jgi:hypothetical protein
MKLRVNLNVVRCRALKDELDFMARSLIYELGSYQCKILFYEVLRQLDFIQVNLKYLKIN